MTTNSELKLYDHLLQFPLFQGMSQGELMQLAGNTRLGFLKLPAGRQVIADGDSCDHLYLLISGTITIETQSDDHTYRMTEWISAPWLVQPEALFGLSTRHSQDVRTVSDTHFITISKDEVLRLLDDFLIFRLNLLNLLSTQSQRRSRHPWRRSPRSLEERITRFITDHVVYPAGAKTLHILMQQLAAEVGDTRLNVSRTLNAMQQKGLLTLHRGRIVIPMLEHLFV